MDKQILQCELRNPNHYCEVESCHALCRFLEEVYDILVYVPKVRHYGVYECLLCGRVQVGECRIKEDMQEA